MQRARALAATLAVVCGSLHLAAVFHFAIVPHEVCAEHGYLTHRPTAFAGKRRQAEPNAAAAPAGATESVHDHCLPSGARERHAVLHAGVWTELGVPPPVVAPLTPTETFALAAADIWRIAPKQSPPRFRDQAMPVRTS